MSDPDLYMTVGDPLVSQINYQWRSANIGPDRIDIPPTNSKNKEDGNEVFPKYYFIGVWPYRTGMNTMRVQLTLLEASKIHIIHFNFNFFNIEPIHKL